MKRIALFLILTIGVGFFNYGQNKTIFDFVEPIQTFSVDNYGTYEDSEGRVWIFSENGLECFDFNNSTKVENSGGRISNDIWRMFKDNSDRIWLVHRGNKASYLKNGVVHSIPYPKDANNLLPDCFYGDTVFFKSRYSKTASYKLLPNNQFEKIKDKNGEKTLFRVSDGNLHVFIKNEITYYTTKNTPKTKLKYILKQIQIAPEEGQLYYNKTAYIHREIKSDTLIFYTDQAFHAVKMSDFFEARVLDIRSIGEDKGVIVETTEGIRFYKNLRTKERDLQTEKVLAYFYKKFGLNFFVTIDSNRNIWITLKRGVIYFIPSFWTNIDSTGLSKFVADIKNFDPNHIIIKTSDACLYDYNLALNQSNLITEKSRILNFFVDNNNLYWFNYNTLNTYNFKSRFVNDYDSSYAKIKSEYIGNNKLLFFNGDVFDNQTIKLKTLHSSFFKESIIRIIPVGHLLIICLNSETILYNPENDHIIKSLKNITVSEAIQLSENVIALINGKSVLFIDNKGNPTGKTIFNDRILDLIQFRGQLLLATTNELYLCDLISNNDKNTLRVTKSFYTNLNNFHIELKTLNKGDNNTYFLMGTNIGLYKVNISEIEGNSIYKTTPIYWSILLNGKPVKKKNSYHFDYNHNSIDFEFNYPSYNTLGHVNYHYKLNKNKWKTNQSGTISFLSLPPGKYTLEIYAENDGIHQSKLTKIQFTIATPFWKKWYFYIFLFLIVIGLLLMLGKLIIDRYRTYFQNRNKLLELELTSLKHQLNPHFVFNSLNNLQSIIIKKDEMEVNEYVVSLSWMMRTLLDNSRTEFISIENEMIFLENAIKILSVKIDGGINYSITCNQPEEFRINVSIRNMVIQPFVENAIIHGLQYLDSNRKLSVHFETTGNKVTVTVEDNGIGRKKSTELTGTESKNHKSWGTTIIEDKSKILKDYFGEVLSFHYEDLYDEDRAIGTRVIILMQLHT